MILYIFSNNVIILYNTYELCHSYPCPRPSQFVSRTSLDNKWVLNEACITFLGRGINYYNYYYTTTTNNNNN